MTTTELINKLWEMMRPMDEDLQILSGRNDDKFSQKVRNLTAHKTFERFGYARYKNGYIEITSDGKLHLKNNKYFLKYLLLNNFAYSNLIESLQNVEKNQDKKKIKIFDENVVVQEGTMKRTETAVYERSTTLRKYAMQYFSINEKIYCKCCNFNFQYFPDFDYVTP